MLETYYGQRINGYMHDYRLNRVEGDEWMYDFYINDKLVINFWVSDYNGAVNLHPVYEAGSDREYDWMVDYNVKAIEFQKLIGLYKAPKTYEDFF